ncbi:MAG: TonB-dependent receptor [Methylococcaceae bacterium]
MKILFSFLLFLGVVSQIVMAEPQILSPLVITSTRTNQDTRLISSTLISRDDIERLQARTVEDALRGLAGVNIVNNGGLGKSTSIFLRGTNSDHILVLIDGVRAGSATLGSTAFQHLPISEIDSIEVIRGPRSSLYGSEALGGVIHIHTRKGADVIAKPTLSFGIGSHDHYQASVGVSGSFKNSWYNLNLGHEKSNGFNSCSGSSTEFFGCFTEEPDADGYRNESGSLRLGHQFGDWLTLDGHALYSDGDNHFDGSFENQSDFVQQVFGGRAKIKATDFWTLTLNGGESRDRSISALDGVETDSFNTQRISFSAQNDLTLFEDQILTLGYDYLIDKIDGSTAYEESSRDDHAFYTQYQGQYQQHELILGFRQDYNQQFGGHSTWNAAWGYQFTNGTVFSASYGTAYKAPTFNQLYFPGFGNSALDPERSRSYEIGLNGQHPWGNWSMNGYITYISNLIAFDSDLNAPNNVDKARIIGLELTADTRIYEFDIRANLTLQNPENHGGGVNNGNLLARRAEEIFRLDVDRRWGDFSFGTTVTAEGRRFDNLSNSRRTGGFVTLDLRAEYEFFEQVRLQAKVSNVLNKHYQTASGYNQDELNLFFTLIYSPKIDI